MTFNLLVYAKDGKGI